MNGPDTWQLLSHTNKLHPCFRQTRRRRRFRRRELTRGQPSGRPRPSAVCVGPLVCARRHGNQRTDGSGCCCCCCWISAQRAEKIKTKQRIWKWKRLLDVRRLSGFSAEPKHFLCSRCSWSFPSCGVQFFFYCAAAFQFSDFCLQLLVFGSLDLRLVIYLLDSFRSVFVKVLIVSLFKRQTLATRTK